MTKNLKLPVYLACLVAPCLLATASVPSLALADEAYKLKNIISLPDGGILRSFDISFVSPTNHRYALAVSATAAFPAEGTAANPRVVVVDTQFNVVVGEYNATPSLAGACVNSATATRNDFGGPNGALIVEKGQNADIWVGDAPHFSPQCTPPASGGAVVQYSSAAVFDLRTGATRGVVVTGGIMRADELCYNPRSDVVLIANDDPADNFITFIGEDSLKVIQKIKFDGTDPNGDKLLANGIEQCAYNPRDGKFYINLPATGTTAAPGPGKVLRISGEAPFHVEAVFSVDPTCGGASGLAIGPGHEIGLACSATSATNAEVIDDRTGGEIALLPGLHGADEMWYDPGSNHYFFGISTPGTLGVADAGPPPSVDTSVPTAPGSHSVAANLLTNEVYVPVRAAAGSLCSTGLDVYGNPGSDAAGCIAVFTSARDGADCVPEGVPVVSVGPDGNPIYKKDRCHGH